MENKKSGLTILRNKVAVVIGSAIAAITGVLISDSPSATANQIDLTSESSVNQISLMKLRTAPVLKLNLNNIKDSHLVAMHGSHKSHSSHSSHSSHKSHSSHRSGGFFS